MDCKGIDGELTCEDEFRLVIQGIPLRELRLLLWNIAITEGRIVQPLKRLPVDIAKLVRYLRIMDDFAKRHEYKTTSMLTL
jgi:hypothetical protein